jgi:glycosyltransferase involved in cell wall biosynthesis
MTIPMRRQPPSHAQPELRGSLDGPLPGRVVGDAVVVRGWHLLGDSPMVGVVISLDGRMVAVASPGSERRPDVAHALGDSRLQWCGWRTEIDLRGWVGEVTLGVRLLPPTGVDIELEPVALHVGAPSAPTSVVDGGLDALSGGADDPLPRGPVNLTGWALAANGDPVSHVDLVVDGVEVGRARIGLERPEEASRLRMTHAGTSGFEHLVDLGAVVAGRLALSEVEVLARVVTLDGQVGTLSKRHFVSGPVAAAPWPQHERPAPGPATAGEDLRLAVFAHSLKLAGGELWLSELLERCGAGRDFECTVIGPGHGPMVDRFEALGIRVHLTGDTPVRHRKVYEGRVEESALWCDRQRFNAVLANSFGAFLGADVGTRMGLPTLWGIHESWDPVDIWSVAYWWRELDPAVPASVGDAMRSLQAMMFVAEATRRMWEPAGPPGRCIAVPYGIDTATLDGYRTAVGRDETRRRLGLDLDTRVLLVVGTTESRKSQTVLTAAFGQLARQYPDAQLVFVGANWTRYANALRSLAANLHLENRVWLVPVVDDVSPWFRAADVLVCAADVESLPRSVLEAMCFGLPVVATSVFGIPELITDGETGYLFEPKDLGAAVGALRRILDADPAQLSAVADAGRRLVMESYDSAGYSHDIFQLIEGLRRDPSKTPAQVLAEHPRP